MAAAGAILDAEQSFALSQTITHGAALAGSAGQTAPPAPDGKTFERYDPTARGFRTREGG
jgi:hypothetical protein